ncbi:hypothetical protein HDU79_006733 [Rhizoclosmatium sp. JEL0117]|nr:hypothetical protein HDU79_006733 [Rhizoclosmatium sp. JEL0117]
MLPILILSFATFTLGLAIKQEPLLINSDRYQGLKSDVTALKHEGFRLISTTPSNNEWLSERDILALYQSKTRFIDRTDQDLESLVYLPPPSRFTPPSKATHQKTVLPLLDTISTDKLEDWLTKFTSFHTRYYQSTTGKDAAEFLYDLGVQLSHAASPTVKLTPIKFKHDWEQFSVILRLEAVVPVGENEPVVILSAHSDSINQWNPWWGRAPGAEDDGSGCATIFEVLRILIESKFIPSRPIEFHFYSAEEAGLLGSQKVAASYKQRQIDVAGVYHADETGYTPKGKVPVIGVSQDYVDEELEGFLVVLLKEYVKGVDIVKTECGYACSDHASWTEAGYAATYLFDTRMEDGPEFVHGSGDTVSKISFEHMSRFVKLGLAFAVEMSLA